MRIKEIFKLIIYRQYATNEKYIEYLRAGGAIIGENTIFYAPRLHPVDETSLPFIEIGNNCRIAAGVIILAHDYSYAALRPVYHCMLRKAGVTKIGNNVFIGMNSIINMDVCTGDNVIIGSGSVVTKDIPDNVVVAGNPARVICTLDEYYKKNLCKFEEYAKIYYSRMSSFLNRELNEKEMGWYVVLWKTANKENILNTIKIDGDFREEVISDVAKQIPKYDSWELFQQKLK